MLTKQENYFYVVVWKEVVQKVEKSTKGPLSETIKCHVLYNINVLNVLYALCISHKLSLSLLLYSYLSNLQLFASEILQVYCSMS